MIPVAALMWGTALAACIALNFTALPDWLGTHLAAPDDDDVSPDEAQDRPRWSALAGPADTNSTPRKELNSWH